jgi:hypothetical protein
VLRSNLSTRPFYNERIVHLLVALGAVIVLTITLFDVGTIVNLSRHNTEVSGWIARDRQETARLANEAARIRGGIDQKGLAIVAASAREANLLIDQRTFSWTAFFNEVEAALPPDVMLVSVRPGQERDATKLSMVVLGRAAEDIDEFIEKLEATGAFEQILARQTDKTGMASIGPPWKRCMFPVTPRGRPRRQGYRPQPLRASPNRRGRPEA